MPTSSDEFKDVIKDFIDSCPDIKTILDIGPGNGTYARLLGKNYQYIGIEAFEPYVSMFKLHELYEEIIIEDAIVAKWPKADCVIFGDVLEHMPMDVACREIKRADEYAHCIISVPLGDCPQGAEYENEFERHRSTWERKETMELLGGWPVVMMGDLIGIFCR
jgi:hypothetical protein